MTRARSDLIPDSSGGVFHVVTRCVRRERLLDRGERKAWLCRGLAAWLRHMGVDLLAYSIMGNHVHLVVRLRPDLVEGWNSAELARHALAVLPARSGPGMEPLSVTPALIERYSENRAWLKVQRTRLSSPSWLLRLVKQELSRRANAEDGCTGHFWERRFTSVALLDAAAT
ncbi:MAG: transposase, partial [Planctomycetes bacterium]|nr:transposase [Planctomycetota bacterium]